MKKAFGILFLIAGLAMIGLGIVALTNASTMNSTYDGQFRSELNHNYREQNSAQQAIGLGLIVGGLFFFIIGIVMVATKSGSQRRKEAELDAMKKMQAMNSQEHTAKTKQQNINIDQLTKQAINLYKQKDYHAAISIIRRAITLDPANHSLHFNLACLYALTRDAEAFSSLETAIEYGYMNFDKIKSYMDLEWLRNHPDYETFVKNGYKVKAGSNNSSTAANSNAVDDLYDQLEKLGKLKEKGLITEEEFQQQKKKILI
jgi:tetratricopeptide (TPR) repeat protein